MLLFDPGGWAVPIPIPVPVPIPQLPKPPTGSWYWRLVEQWAYYLRTRWLIPNNVTTPPNNWPGTVGPWFNTFFALLYIELNFPAALADGTLEGKPVRPPDAPIGTNPVKEQPTGLPTFPQGRWEYRNVKRFRAIAHTTTTSLEDPPLFPPQQSSWEWTTVEIRERAFSADVVMTTNTAYVRTGEGQLDEPVPYFPLETQVFQTDQGWELNDDAIEDIRIYGGSRPNTGWPDFDTDQRMQTLQIELVDFEYHPDELFTRPEHIPGPITPQRIEFPETAPIPQPSPRVEPLPMTEVAPQPIRPRVLRPPTTTTGPVQVLTAPPIPADFDVVAPAPLPIPNVIPSPTPEKITETDLDGLPIPAPGITTKVTDALQHFPWPGAEGIVPGGVPSTLKGIANEIGRVEAKTSMIGAALEALSGIGGGGGGPEKEVAGTTYTLSGVCETPNDAGAQPVFSTPIGTQPYSDAVIARLDAMQYLLQAHLGFKTPICDSTKPQLFPFWRSIRFESAEKTANGRNVARKLLRYRGDSAGDVDFLGEYWADFEWETGPVVVFHKGTPVGTPQVWASTEAEGQRVLRHAFREAGIDPDQTGQWGVSSSNNPRYGVRHTVRLACVDGCWSATARPGPNGWPEASVAWLDP